MCNLSSPPSVPASVPASLPSEPPSVRMGPTRVMGGASEAASSGDWPARSEPEAPRGRQRYVPATPI
eukprot:3389950-Heterocapsa_arctica.AAC.1